MLFTRYFQNKYETEFFATLVTILALGLVFSTLCLLPVDIFLVSSTVDVSKGIKKSWATIQVIERMTFTMSIAYYGIFLKKKIGSLITMCCLNHVYM